MLKSIVFDQANKNHRSSSAFAYSSIVFTRKWKNPTTIEHDPEGFRNAANTVLKHVHQRIVQENRELYLVVEAVH